MRCTRPAPRVTNQLRLRLISQLKKRKCQQMKEKYINEILGRTFVCLRPGWWSLSLLCRKAHACTCSGTRVYKCPGWEGLH